MKDWNFLYLPIKITPVQAKNKCMQRTHWRAPLMLTVDIGMKQRVTEALQFNNNLPELISYYIFTNSIYFGLESYIYLKQLKERDNMRMKPKEIRKAITEAVVISISSISFFALVVTALFLSALMSEVQALDTLTLLKKYDLGEGRWSEGLDFHDGFLWQTTSGKLYKLDTDGATDTDGDGDYDLPAEKTWNLTHLNHSESSVWFNNELYNFTFRDSNNDLSDDIYKLDLNDDETYQWEHVGDGESQSNWGSCRDKKNPGESIIYSGHYDDLLWWYDPNTGNTTKTLEITGIDEIEDLGMDRYGTIWTSTCSDDYPDLYRIDLDAGEVMETFEGPDELVDYIDGAAIRSVGGHDVMYMTGKNDQYIWEYQVPELSTAVLSGVGFVSETFELYPNYPNPFNRNTTVSFLLESDAEVNLSVFNAMGQKVRTLINGKKSSGRNSTFWNGMNDTGKPVKSGIYLFTITVKTGNKEFNRTIKGILRARP